jgi:mono/diheme cytochrome c family protein
MAQGVLLRFDVRLDPAQAADPANYTLATWRYKRAYTYGSAQYKADGTPGNDWLTPSAATLSADGRAVFIAVPGMRPVEQLRVGWSIATADGAELRQNAYTTTYELVAFDAAAEGFPGFRLDLTPRRAATARTEVATVDEGRRLATVYGCVACHSVTATVMTNVGPTWQGLFGSRRDYVTDQGRKGTLIADEAYLRESILEPNAKRHAAYLKSEFAMPSFAGVLTEAQIDALILYIKSLR